MIKKIISIFYWSLFKRLVFKFKNIGFSASIRTYVYPNCNFSKYNTLLGNSTLFNTSFGDFTYMAGGQISNAIVGSFTSIGPDVKIGGFGKHPTNWISTNPIFYSSKAPQKIKLTNDDYFKEFESIEIGNDVWIGANVFILDGIKVEDGAIIGAGSIVTKNVSKYEIVAGVPAKHIRYRFSENEINKLCENPWWKQDVNFFVDNSSLFRSNNVNDLICKINFNRNKMS